MNQPAFLEAVAKAVDRSARPKCRRCIPNHRTVPGSRKIRAYTDLTGREHWHYVDGGRTE